MGLKHTKRPTIKNPVLEIHQTSISAEYGNET
jgi:hypothetical protein